ncbi:F-box protein At5g49610-like [Diospyros lotus]|uniref:F-box protein At5g49610-like n=1 Tax=Diospyros lotus TaxID=55363 RepID=UPI00224DB495|nr:F-box protein At5g49610-like [Diospyros lotus]XP_052196737.1 F-box protein At5g49610-like [Diospyros lotus]XP_052196738.1 F-box protein At5g49610-like [Diospyros lotus]
MDQGKTSNRLASSKNSLIYMDLRDIIREHALSFLPAKSLIRFQGVCRDWKLRILTPFSAYSQSLSYRAFSGLFCQPPSEAPSFISIDPVSCGVPDPSLNFFPERVVIRSSSNGLLCCQGLGADKAYYICNPTTKQWKKLPKHSFDHGPKPALVLIFEPTPLNFVPEFKLVCAFPSTDFDNATEFEIYSSTEGTWKVSREVCFASKSVVSGSGVYADGTIYWMVKRHGILAYDLAKDRSQIIQGYYGARAALGTVNGKLALAFSSGPAVTVNVLANVYSNTMQMHSDARTWEGKIQLSLDNHQPRLGHEQVTVLYVGCNVVVTQVGTKILCYDMVTKKLEVMGTSAPEKVRFFPYVNSMVSF